MEIEYFFYKIFDATDRNFFEKAHASGAKELYKWKEGNSNPSVVFHPAPLHHLMRNISSHGLTHIRITFLKHIPVSEDAGSDSES